MKSRRVLLAVASALLAAAPLQAQVLNFEGLAVYPNASDTFVQNFYNGGTSSAGFSGTNYGIEFSTNALGICLNTLGTACPGSNTSRGGIGNPTSQKGGLFFLSGASTFMNRAAGFTTGFSFFYSAINSGGSFSVWDGLNGTGSLLGTVALGVTPSTCDIGFNAGFCPFQAAGLAFAGTGKSVTFSGVANQIVFDDVTFGSDVPDTSTVPEPATMVLLGAGLAAVAVARRRKRA